MGRDTDITGIIREFVQFLERLAEVKLPSILENVREDLLARSKGVLVGRSSVTFGPSSSSPEPYLSMSPGNGSAARGLLLLAARDALTWKQDEPQEYVDAEESRVEKLPTQQDYYETFVDVHRPAETAPTAPIEQNKRENVDSTLVEIYSSFSAELTKSKCVKCGPLRKGGKKLFLFEQRRDCWAGLVGSYMLIYGTEKDNRPYMVQSIRGFTARPLPNTVPRDQKKSESTFELLSPGNKPQQFIARSPKDMEQWIAKISRVNSEEEDVDDGVQGGQKGNILQEKNVETGLSEMYQDVGNLKENDAKNESTFAKDKTMLVQKDEANKENGIRNESPIDADAKSKLRINKNKDTPPPLPARIPRRLPSLPSEKNVVSVHSDTIEYDEEDDFYHRIDDFKDMARYQNVTKKSKKTEETLASYDDVQSVVKEKKTESEAKGRNEKRKSIENKSPVVVEEIYDDVISVLQEKKIIEEKEAIVATEETNNLPSYDDIQSLAATTEGKKYQQQKKSTEEPAKSPVKKSFLDRVRSGRRQQRESSGKSEKRMKRKTPTPPPPTVLLCEEESPLYDDVSSWPVANRKEEIQQEEDIPEYNCPPPPRPVYVPPVSVPEVEDIYDDIGVGRERTEDELPTTMDGSLRMNGGQTNGIHPNERNFEEIDGEHYQSPKSSLPVAQQTEELYDDIAILADFTARQREINKKPEIRKTPSPEKKPWNRRFGGSRKSKCSELLADGSTAEVNGQRSSGEVDDLVSSSPEQSQKNTAKRNTFQKLINKMEYSLGKASSLSPGKTNSANDGT